ncbi:MAG: nicotinate (nicotinamide) nucleotide adenylyltransferase [Ferruginibacter sp.]
MKVGLYFGSFNPIHIGHLIIANHIINNTKLDQVWFVISPQNPFKKSASLLNEYHRLHMVNIAIDGQTKLKSCSVEFKLPRPSYTIDSLVYLKEKYPNNKFSIIIGSDSFNNLNKWKNHLTLIKETNFYIYKRPGFEITETFGAEIQIVKAPLLDISSTEIRKLISEKKSIRFLVPDAVKEEIEQNGYYKV